MKSFNSQVNEEFYYCYDEQCVNFLIQDKGLPYICHGKSKKTKEKFFMFHRTNKLDDALTEYQNIKIK